MKNYRIGVIGLGYVGLPLGLAFSEVYETIAFDINAERINELKRGLDRTEEVDLSTHRNERKIYFTSEAKDLAQCNVYVVTVPTPVLQDNTPDLKPSQYLECLYSCLRD